MIGSMVPIGDGRSVERVTLRQLASIREIVWAWEVLRMKRKTLAFGIFFVLLVIGACSVGWAQQVQGSFTGQVTDSSGAVIGGAQVTAVERDTGFTRSAATLADGSYLIPLLPPGHYRLEVQAAGFEKTMTGAVQKIGRASWRGR